MLRRTWVWGALVLGLSVGLTAQRAAAVTYAESGDTGDLPGTAQAVGAGVNYITGELASLDVDMFCLQFGTGGLITFETDHGNGGTGNHSDPELYLFDSAGGVIASDDDSGALISALNAKITANLAPGTYYLAVAPFYTMALDSGLNLIADGYSSAVGAVVTSWGTPDSPGTYSISISQATVGSAVPEPATAGLGLLALAGVAAAATRRRARA